MILMPYPPPRGAPVLQGEMFQQVWSGWFRKVAQTFNTYINQPPVVSTVAGLSAAPNKGQRAFVSDATVTVFASIVAGGGTNPVPVYYDGANWRIG